MILSKTIRLFALSLSVLTCGLHAEENARAKHVFIVSSDQGAPAGIAKPDLEDSSTFILTADQGGQPLQLRPPLSPKKGNLPFVFPPCLSRVCVGLLHPAFPASPKFHQMELSATSSVS